MLVLSNVDGGRWATRVGGPSGRDLCYHQVLACPYTGGCFEHLNVLSAVPQPL
jgi:hypothetical protein